MVPWQKHLGRAWWREAGHSLEDRKQKGLERATETERGWGQNVPLKGVFLVAHTLRPGPTPSEATGSWPHKQMNSLMMLMLS